MLSLFVLVVSLVAAQSLKDDYADGAWKKTLDNCWTDPSCNRVMTIAHGGDWNLTVPYDSKPAFEKAFDEGADAVKGDFRVSSDNIAMIMHSSPVEIYESFDCFNWKVEEHTSAENAQCHMLNTTYTFQPVPDMLKWADQQINFMFCVKESTDIPRAITTLIENDATHRAFLEISVTDMINTAAADTVGWAEVYYIIEVHNVDDFNRMIAAPAEVIKRTFLFEFNDWDEWSSADLSSSIASAKALGVRTVGVSRDNAATATVKNHMDIFNAGFDVVYTYNLENAITARKTVNARNGVTPV